MKIKNIEVDFDFLDADDIERFEKESRKVLEECESKEKQKLPMSEVIREECRIINNFFDNVFGEGISEKLFKGKNNLADHIKCYEEIVKAKIAQEKDLQGTLDRYQPNREQRRYNKYHRR